VVSNSGAGSFRGDLDEQLEKLRRRRNVVFSVHQFIIVPMLLRMTDCVAALPSRLHSSPAMWPADSSARP
jgi:hypothetical protein